MRRPSFGFRFWLFFSLLLVGIIAAGIATLCDGDDSLQRVRKDGTIIIGYAIEAPYAFLTPEGEVTGEAPEIAKVVAARLDIPHIYWRQLEFGSLIGELQAGRIDAIAAGMFITPQRARRVSFSLPTYRARSGLLVAKGNPRGLHSYSQAAGLHAVKIAVLDGSVEQDQLHRLGLREPRLLTVPDALTGRIAVETGGVDGLALSSPTVHWMALQQKNGGTEAAEPFETGKDGGGLGAFAFRKEDHRLLAAWNEALATFVGSPEHLVLVGRFGLTKADIPLPAGNGKEVVP
ncbi:transporter substrate-binding domain-containing protein [Geomonas azotofigens]|uniref:transporter substrate-binding domain-containing protein n=1 Tax=Geomonas azotofigens TaxID=2843196 RepID=UPI001C125B61|nr:transporter substrate-binding domain-containing protein [Geomonas azotofigens]MBU5613892.1 transporter substrate-binding domain-containing protein [Geomonas azotofigens]